ncbi:MAG TPA: S-layer homology domain-containing protein, partial [Sedimentibacter sp.]|nr:S-layer homology domain-containing protein [Sedimentibacter sp.]
MKNIIKKTSAFCLCALMVINMNLEVSAGVLDDILGDGIIEVTDMVYDTKAVLFSDIDGHWAKEWIEKAVNSGFVTGYEDGTFKPDRTITRAEFSTMLNKAIKVESSTEINFSDVNDKD